MVGTGPEGEITAMLRDWSSGKRTGEDQLFQLVYPHLRSMAGALFRREKSNHLLQPTGVVNELFLKLLTQRKLDFQDRQHFYSFAARIMRRVLIDHARSEHREKRDGGEQVALSDQMRWSEVSFEEALDIDRALTDLEALDARKCTMVEMRFLLGFTADETAQIMQVSKSSVDRDLRFVRGWLNDRLHPSTHDTSPVHFAPTTVDIGMQEPFTSELTNSPAWESANWTQLQELFHLAATAPPGERTRILSEASSDKNVVDRVLALLAAADGPEDADTASQEQWGRRIGPYALLRHLGTGGLGSVYLAERIIGGTVMQCAVKVLSLHAAGAEFEVRFHREQQILYSLDHPNITRMLDAGYSDTAQPYLAMEFVDGVDIVSFCNVHCLTVAHRLSLFQQVCKAVAFAHRALIVHLDLKPSNILVTTDGTVKLLDFGTSKLISSEGANTTTIFATPAYASPEQLRNLPVTTACDVYALGAILFELLSGARPYGDCSASMLMEHALREQEPPQMSAAITQTAPAQRAVTWDRLFATIRGDLNSIVTRCLRSRPQDRYASVDDLSEDVQRYLDGRPVLARRQTGFYRATKFVRRNRLAIAVTGLAAVVLLSSLTYGIWRQHQALAAAHRAVQMQDFMTRLLRLSHSGATGKPAATVAEMLQVGAHILPSFISNPTDLRAARLSLAESMNDDDDHTDALPILLSLVDEAHRTGDVVVEAKSAAIAGDIQYLLGNTQDGNTLTTRALAVAHDRRVPPEIRTQVTALYVENHDETGDRGEQSMSLLRSAIAESDETHASEDQTASAMNILGLGLQARGHREEARQYFQRSLAIYQRSPYATCDVAATEKYLALLAYKQADDAEALRLFQLSYNMNRQCAGDDDLGTLSAQAWMGFALAQTGHPGDAISILEPAIPRWRKAVGADSQHMRTPLHMLSVAYLRAGRYGEAEATSREEIRVLKGRAAQHSVNMSASEWALAASLYGQGLYSQALPIAQAAVSDYPHPQNPAPSETRQMEEINQLLADTRKKLEQS